MIIRRWNFDQYPVSNESISLIRKYRTLPLFHIDKMKPALYSRVPRLRKLRVVSLLLSFSR